MSVDPRAHIESPVLQERAVLRRTVVWGVSDGRYTNRKAISVRGHSGDDIRITLEDLGEALRMLKVRPVDLGYMQPRARRKLGTIPDPPLTGKAKPCA